ncbi:hypothetical protein NDQ53_14415 [Rossellomorea marisflavi]|uniref:hypothetical protein n=1 Tax=Rossellomorea marisflavi TaxID=189381 RepID=UPI0020422F02|nr:hypothetical protein [Rossellomorea marisflavi]MCM2590493.1 hypothetical protein [Rossellomorea marisflavi]
MKQKPTSIFNAYSHEISNIMNQLTHLENNRYYENTGARMDGSVSTNARQLKEKIKDLLIKIDKEAPSDIESFYE